MTVDGRGNRVENLLSDALLAGESSNSLLVLVSQIKGVLVADSFQVIDFNQSLEDREAMLGVGNLVVPVQVNTDNLYFITGTCPID
jgi:hypothetical protein